MLRERKAERLEQRGQRVVERVPKSQPQHELAPAGKIQLSGERDVPVQGGVKLPVHLVVLGQVGPAVRAAHVAARPSQEWGRGPEREPDPSLMRHQHLAPPLHRDVPAVPPATALEMGREQREQPQRLKRLVESGDLRPDQDTRLIGIGDDLFR